MRIIIACLALILMAGPVMACSYAEHNRGPSYKDRIAGNESIFLGRVIESTPTLVVFKVLNSRKAHAVGDIIRVLRLPPRYCDGQPSYRIGDIWLHDGSTNTDNIAFPYPENYGDDNGHDLEKLIQNVSYMLDNQHSPLPPAPILTSTHLFETGEYSWSKPCTGTSTNNNEYKLSVFRESRAQGIRISVTSCESTLPCNFNEHTAPYDGEREIIVKPIGQTACSLTLTQSDEGVTVKENDRAACPAALNCDLPNGFNTAGYLQKVN